MSSQSLVIAGGVYHLLLIVFHLAFWKLFDWKQDLASLRFLNRAVMQVLNLSLTFVFVVFAYISLFHATDLVTTPLGRTILILIGLLWLFRAGEQVVFFGLRKALSVAFTLFFLLGSALYWLALL